MSTIPVATPTTSTPSRLRWRFPAIVLVLELLLLGYIWGILEPDRTIQVFSSMGSIALTVLLLGLWWMFFSGITWASRGIGVAVVVCLGVVFNAIVRVEGVTGEVFPILAWRWSPTREERAKQFFEQQATSKPVEQQPDQPVELPPLKALPRDWPDYRGAQRDSRVRGWTVIEDWEREPPPLLWKHPVGPAWSSFAVVDGWAWTQEQRETEEVVVAYAVATGETRWTHTDPARFSDPMGGPGPRATPVFYDNRLYTQGAAGRLNCLNPQTGELLWTHDILQENGIELPEYGIAGSPLVYDDLVVVNAGGKDQQGLIAYDRLTGEKRWQHGTGKASYVSPQLFEIAGVRQIVIFDGIGGAGHDPRTGIELWKFPWSSTPGIQGAQPVLWGNKRLTLSTGYGVGSVQISLAVDQGKWTATEVWQSKQFKAKFNSVVQIDRYIYGLDEGILTCLDLETGKRMWKGGRFGYGQLLEINGILLVLAESGEVCFVRAQTKKFEESGRFSALSGKTWNHPVLWEGTLLVRNGEEAAGYDVRSWLKRDAAPAIEPVAPLTSP